MIKLKKFNWANEHFDDYETQEGETRYYLTPDGKFPSMTSILSLLDKDSDWLEKWQKRVGVDVAEKITKEAADRGNSLHDLSEKYLRNELTRDEITGKGKVLFNRAKKYLNDIDLVIGTEVALYSKKDRYAGRTDAIVMLNDELTILDHKNSRKTITQNNVWTKQKRWKYELQCYGYSRALNEMKGYQATKGCLIVSNHETSNSERFIFDLTPYEKEMDILLCAYYEDVRILKESEYYRIK